MHRKQVLPNPPSSWHPAMAVALDTNVPGITTVQWRSLALSGDISVISIILMDQNYPREGETNNTHSFVVNYGVYTSNDRLLRRYTH